MDRVVWNVSELWGTVQGELAIEFDFGQNIFTTLTRTSIHQQDLFLMLYKLDTK